MPSTRTASRMGQRSPAITVIASNATAGNTTSPSPVPCQPGSFTAHVRPQFRDKDLQSMSRHFDLGSCDDGRANADKILDRLAAENMSCDGPWPADRVGLFRRWRQTEMRP